MLFLFLTPLTRKNNSGKHLSFLIDITCLKLK